MFERRALRECPQRGLEGFDDVTGAADPGRLATQERSGGDVVDLRCERLAIPQSGDWREQRTQQIGLGLPLKGADDEPRKVAAAVDGL